MPLLSPLRMNVCTYVFFFSREMWDASRPKYPKKYNNPNIWRNKTKQNKAFVGLAGALQHLYIRRIVYIFMLDVCKIPGSSSRRGHWTLKEFGATSLSQPSLYVCQHSIYLLPINITMIIRCYSVRPFWSTQVVSSRLTGTTRREP